MKKILYLRIILVLVILSSLLMVVAYSNSVKAQETNVCALHENRMWAWTLDGAWLSMTKTGNWKTDSWFYMLKSGEPVVVIQIDAKLGYYLVCYDFESGDGWQPLYGWVQKDRILLQSEITPSPQ